MSPRPSRGGVNGSPKRTVSGRRSRANFGKSNEVFQAGPLIISISRRGDIPRFHFDWFLERIKAGFTDAVNPFNRNQVKRVSLKPEAAEVLVFWTRDPRVLLENGGELENLGYRWYVMTTLTGYPLVLEENPPGKTRVIHTLRALADRFGPERVIWRYDPLVLSSLTGKDFHRANFGELSGALRGAVRRVIISGYDEYPRTRRRMGALEAGGLLTMTALRDGESRFLAPARKLLGELAGMAKEAGMVMQSCAEEDDLASLGIAGGACVDRDLIRELWGIEVPGRANQRRHCRCAPSVDIGSYGPCPARCAYCYAR
jgi:hypothetical protein